MLYYLFRLQIHHGLYAIVVHNAATITVIDESPFKGNNEEKNNFCTLQLQATNLMLKLHFCTTTECLGGNYAYFIN